MPNHSTHESSEGTGATREREEEEVHGALSAPAQTLHSSGVLGGWNGRPGDESSGEAIGGSISEEVGTPIQPNGGVCACSHAGGGGQMQHSSAARQQRAAQTTAPFHQ